jgi:hypothetical protein
VPRSLGDVLHYFLPELDPSPAAGPSVQHGSTVVVPVGVKDVIRAALVWNLGVELARQGGSVGILAPIDPSSAPVWPEPGRGPLGVELHGVPATGLDAVLAALDRFDGPSRSLPRGQRFVLLPIPAPWLFESSPAADRLGWILLLARPGEREILETYATLKRVAALWPRARLGLSVFGVRSRAEAEHTFRVLAAASARHLGAPLMSYGLLVDDLHLARSIVTGRPLGVTAPQSPAARALSDVARLLREDA